MADPGNNRKTDRASADMASQRRQLAEHGLLEEFGAHVGCDIVQWMGEALVVERRRRKEILKKTGGQWLLEVAGRLTKAGCRQKSILEALDALIKERDQHAHAAKSRPKP